MRKLLNCGHVSDKANGTLHPYKSYHHSCPVSCFCVVIGNLENLLGVQDLILGPAVMLTVN